MVGAGLQFEAELSMSSVAYEQGPEGRAGVSHGDLWGKAFPGERGGGGRCWRDIGNPGGLEQGEWGLEQGE